MGCGDTWASAAQFGYAAGQAAHQAASDAALRMARLWCAAGGLAWLAALGTLGLVARERRRWWAR